MLVLVYFGEFLLACVAGVELDLFLAVVVVVLERAFGVAADRASVYAIALDLVLRVNLGRHFFLLTFLACVQKPVVALFASRFFLSMICL